MNFIGRYNSVISSLDFQDQLVAFEEDEGLSFLFNILPSRVLSIVTGVFLTSIPPGLAGA